MLITWTRMPIRNIRGSGDDATLCARCRCAASLSGLSCEKIATAPRAKKSAPRTVSRIAEALPPLPRWEVPKTIRTITMMRRSRNAAPAVNTQTLARGRFDCDRIRALSTTAMGAATAAASP